MAMATGRVCIGAIVVLDSKDRPLHLHVAAPAGASPGYRDRELELLFSSYAQCSLDLLAPKLERQQQAAATTPAECYLGQLLPIDEYKVYAYATAAGVKFLMIGRDLLINETEMRQFFAALHKHYVAAVSSPFAKSGAPLTSPAFDRAMDTLVDAFDARLAASGR